MSRRVVAALATWIVFALVTGVGAAVVVGRGPDGPPHPDRWDPRVIDIAAFVEDERGLDFDHPVFVDFLTPEEYSQLIVGDDSAVTDDDRERFADLAGLYRALGIAEGELDLLAGQRTASDAGTLAFYSIDDERIRVRGTEITPSVEVTIAHELTHALQAQNFDLDPLVEGPEGGRVAFRALVEGDAIRVEDAYIAEALTDEERAAYSASTDSDRAAAEEALTDVPPAILAFFDAPYALGQPFVRLLDAVDGNAAVDDALRDPPASEEGLLDPVAYLTDTIGPSGDDGPLTLDVPDDADVVESGAFGVVSWFLVLAERIDPFDALQAADGWAADGFVAVVDEGVVCVTARFEGDRPEDVAEMRAALNDWAATMPPDVAQVRPGDDHVEFRSCDPGPDVATGTTGRLSEALVVPSARSFFAADFVGTVGLEIRQAGCASSSLLSAVGYERLTADDESYFRSDEVADRVRAAIGACS